ncbi:hypothetical protein [Dactylosporangium sp. NPDC051541]|uniref:hypothetical protein n=1 Tax=Dactylosporangium sp. NPDC051541 TaxID=3363977 RepID=UPI0037A3332F
MNQYNYRNRSKRDLYAHQGTGDMNISQTQYNLGQSRKTLNWTLLVMVVVDVAFFFYGMMAYTGHNTSADTWRAFIFLALVVVTLRLLRRRLRR